MSQIPVPGRVVADPRRIAGQRDDVADPERVGAEQLRLEGHQVPVARRAVDEALEVEVVLDPERHGQGAHPDPGHRRVGDVDEVDAGVAQEPGGLDRPLDPDAPRRVDLDRDDEPAGVEQLGQARRGRRVVGRWPRRRCDDRSTRDVRGRRAGRRGRRRRRVSGRVERRPHRGDVLGRRPAAATDDPRAGREQAWRDVPEVLGARGVDEAPLEPLREPGVRHDRSRRVRRRPGAPIASSASRQAAGPGPAVDADRVRARRGSRRPRPRPGCCRRPATSSSPNVSEAMTGHVGCAAGLVDREDAAAPRSENVSSTIRSTPPSSRPSICSRNAARAARLRDDRTATRRRTERPDRTTDQRIASADLASLAGELCRPPVERADLSLESPGGQSMAVGAERQRLDQLGAGLEVFAMGSSDHLRMGRDELLETGPLRHATAEQQRPHPAVDEERAGGQIEPGIAVAAGRRTGEWVIGPLSNTRWSATGPAMERPFLLGRVPGSSLIVQEDLPGIGTLPTRRR